MIDLDKNFIDFLNEIVSTASQYGNIIEHIHMKQNGPNLTAMMTATDRSVTIVAHSMKEFDLNECRMCLGNLRFLKQMISSNLITDETNVTIATIDRNDKPIAAKIVVSPNERIEMVYICTDPARSSITKPMVINIEDWPVGFPLEEDGVKKIESMRKIHAAAPSTGKEDVLQINALDDRVAISYGIGGTHNSILELDAIIDGDLTEGIYLLSDQFTKTVTMASKNDDDASVEICPRAMRISYVASNSIAEFEVYLVGRKIREKE